ncbi:phosphotransferase enzyme family protein [Nocardiopsis terrae]
MAESSPPLTSETALRLATESEPEFAWSSRGARILGPVGENATVLLPEPRLVLRICASTERGRAARELSVAHWLRENDVPAVRAAEEFPSPVLFRGWVITVWEFIPGIESGVPSTIGTTLRQLHRLDTPALPGFSELDPLDGVAGYIGQASLERSETAFLRARLGELHDDYARLRFALPRGPVHGDAHRKNIVRDGHGDPLVLDLERFSVGPREWDLVVAAVYQRVGWYTSAEYEDFTSAYGWDVRSWSGYETLAAVRELRMTSWLCARTGREPRLLPEARRRIASLKRPDTPKHWQPGT